MMIQPASATSALPCVDIHFDDLILAGALPALVAGAHETSAHSADAAILDLARPPLSDEEDEEAPQDAADDDEDEDEEDEDEDDEEEDDAEEDEDKAGDDDDDEEEDEEDEDEDDDDDDDDEEEEKKTDAGIRHLSLTTVLYRRGLSPA